MNTAEACGGTDLVKKLVSGLTQGTGLQRIAMVDVHGYDCYPAIASLEVGYSLFSSCQVDTKPIDFLAWFAWQFKRSHLWNSIGCCLISHPILSDRCSETCVWNPGRG